MPQTSTKFPPPPGPRGHPLIGCLLELQRAPHRCLVAYPRTYGDVIGFRAAHWMFYQVNHPDFIRHILADNHRNYTKDTLHFNIIRSVTGQGLFTSDGELWQRQRRLMQPAFSRQRLAQFAPLMIDATMAMLDRWDGDAKKHPIDVEAEMLNLTLSIAGKALFNVDLSGEAKAVGQAFETTLQQITHRARHPFSAPDFVPTPRNRRFKAALRTLDHFIYALIDDRRRGNVQNEDLLTILLNADDPQTGETMSDHQLRDEVLTLLFGGHETTAILLTWSFYLLSKFPEVAKRLRRELADVLGGRPPTVDDLGDLQYTRRVLEETLRIYPPIWSTSRRSIEAETIGGYHIPGGAMIGPSPYAIHRHPDFWENPEGFDPNRFTPECIADRPRYAYIPFGGGPRICIGRHFAMMEAMLILATVAQRYRLDLVPEHPVELAILATLRPRYGMLMTLHPID